MRYIVLLVNVFYAAGLVKTGNRLARLAKNCLGFYRAHFSDSVVYDQSWWDERFYGSTILDKNTICPSIDEYATAYHYASIELIIAKELFRLQKFVKPSAVLDVGTGAGHWINFYQRIGAKKLYGIDVSKKVIDSLSAKYSEPNVRLINGTVDSFRKEIDTDLDVVNAIGVMFHIVDDAEWISSLEAIHAALKPGGLLVVGGYFGLLNGLNVDVDSNGVNKRLRSAKKWKKVLQEVGFGDVKIIKNSVAYNIKRRLPENNVLIAIKLQPFVKPQTYT